MSRLLCTCGKSYDVSGRAPGARVRCRACQTVLTIPEGRKLDAAARTASERLRRARGEPCPKHPKTLALDPCERCQRWMCEACRAKAPSSHICRDCAPTVGATQALPIDFGFLATPAIAARLIGRALPWVFALNVIAHSFKWLVAIPFIIATLAIKSSIQVQDPSTPEVVLLISALALTGIVVSLFEIVLIPAADIVLFDHVLREWPAEEYPHSFGATLKMAVRRAWERKGALALTFLLLIAAVLGSLLIMLPFALMHQLVEDSEVIMAGLVFSIPAMGAAVGAFGLAIPAVILEHRTAPAAFGRAFSLARLRPLIATAFGTIIVFVGLFLTYRLSQFEGSWGLVPALVVGFAADIAWPAVLVAAYHGLVAEEARLVGRRS